MQTINEFLELFYSTISFECGEAFKSTAFRELFYPFAALVENVGNDNCFLVSSAYKKTYSRDQKDIVEHGKNNMTVINDKGKFKIVSIAW